MIVYNSVYSIFSVSHRAESQKWVILLVPDVPNIAMCCTFFSLEFYATKVSGGGGWSLGRCMTVAGGGGGGAGGGGGGAGGGGSSSRPLLPPGPLTSLTSSQPDLTHPRMQPHLLVKKSPAWSSLTFAALTSLTSIPPPLFSCWPTADEMASNTCTGFTRPNQLILGREST